MIFIGGNTGGGDEGLGDTDSPARLDRVDEDGGDGGGGRLRRAIASQKGGNHGEGFLHFSPNPRCWRSSESCTAFLRNRGIGVWSYHTLT